MRYQSSGALRRLASAGKIEPSHWRLLVDGESENVRWGDVADGSWRMAYWRRILALRGRVAGEERDRVCSCNERVADAALPALRVAQVVARYDVLTKVSPPAVVQAQLPPRPREPRARPTEAHPTELRQPQPPPRTAAAPMPYFKAPRSDGTLISLLKTAAANIANSAFSALDELRLSVDMAEVPAGGGDLSQRFEVRPLLGTAVTADIHTTLSPRTLNDGLPAARTSSATSAERARRPHADLTGAIFASPPLRVILVSLCGEVALRATLAQLSVASVGKPPSLTTLRIIGSSTVLVWRGTILEGDAAAQRGIQVSGGLESPRTQPLRLVDLEVTAVVVTPPLSIDVEEAAFHGGVRRDPDIFSLSEATSDASTSFEDFRGDANLRRSASQSRLRVRSSEGGVDELLAASVGPDLSGAAFIVDSAALYSPLNMRDQGDANVSVDSVVDTRADDVSAQLEYAAWYCSVLQSHRDVTARTLAVAVLADGQSRARGAAAARRAARDAGRPVDAIPPLTPLLVSYLWRAAIAKQARPRPVVREWTVQGCLCEPSVGWGAAEALCDLQWLRC